jgi:acyl-coenzyme A thioesterase PaaI-like protein
MKNNLMTKRSPYGELVGAKVLHHNAYLKTIEMEFCADTRFTNLIGTVAGAMTAGLLDAVTGVVANADLPDDLVAVHKTMSVECGRIVARTERNIRSHGELFDDSDNQVASAEALLRILPAPDL